MLSRAWTAYLAALALACGPSADHEGAGGDGGGENGPDAGSIDDGPLVCQTPADAGGFEFVEIATWRGGATAAYSMIHDDMCDYSVRGIAQYALPALAERGLAAGVGPIVAECDAEGMWDAVVAAEAAGNEIVSHSYTHPEITVENAPKEVVDAKAEFEKHLENPITFYIFPFDYWTPETVAAVAAAGHLGARAGDRDDNDGFDNPPINPATPDNDFAVEFDVWPRTYSKYALFRAEDILAVHVHNAVERGGWAVREFHSVIPDGEAEEGNGFGPVPLSVYESHLDFLVKAWEANAVWTAPPSAVVKYRRARSACGVSVAGDTIDFDTSNPDCTKYATPISVIVRTGTDLPSVMGTQAGEPVATRKIAPSTFSVTADPTAGPVALSGCSDSGPVVSSEALPPKPTPADSVCELETVVGTGSPGQMDDLERPAEQFQVLPNPSQADGRTGSWSWYPQNAVVEMLTEGDNTVLHYAGTNLAAWTGATLAFLGGNGAGTCYDATAYKGIRFKIRGTVQATDELNNKVILSVVTAETQSRTFGGDLDGEGGHFHRIIDLTPDFQTISITWAELAKPTWGTTMSLSSVATGKLQALDWGVTNTATSFDIAIDDIELF